MDGYEDYFNRVNEVTGNLREFTMAYIDSEIERILYNIELKKNNTDNLNKLYKEMNLKSPWIEMK